MTWRGGYPNEGNRPPFFAKGYKEYINGPLWRAYRTQYFTRHFKACRICQSVIKVQLHHLDHQNYMSTNDRDYVPLCEIHHKIITRGFQTRRNRQQTMRIYTLEYIAMHRKG